MTATVTKLAVVKQTTKRAARNTSTKASQARPSGKPAKVTRSTRINRRFAVAAGVGAATLTILSLDHLSCGISAIMHAPGWQSYVMASAIDLGFVTAELALIMCDEKTVASISRYAVAIVWGTLIASAGLNVMACTAGTEGWAMVPGILAGCGIPAAIYGFSRLAAKLWR